jgi:hypothetical protein
MGATMSEFAKANGPICIVGRGKTGWVGWWQALRPDEFYLPKISAIEILLQAGVALSVTGNKGGVSILCGTWKPGPTTC